MPATRLSRYEFADIHQDEEGRLFYDVPDPAPRTLFPEDDSYTVAEGDTLFTIAWRAYKAMLDPDDDIRPTQFYWAIAEVNGIVDPVAPLEIGRKIRIPAISTLESEILVPVDLRSTL